MGYTEKDIYDTKGRVRRDIPNVPGIKIDEGPDEPNETHFKILQFIHQGGGYSTTPIIHKWAVLTGITKQKGKKGQQFISENLKWMRRKWALLECPHQQFDVKRANRFPLLYKLTKKGKKLLKDLELDTPNVPPIDGFYKHQLMAATWYQNTWLDCLEKGIEFKLQHEISPTDTHFMLGGEKLIPDWYMLIKPRDKWFLIFNETDRSTEFKTGNKKSTWGRKIRLYNDLFIKHAYRTVLDVPGALTPLLVAITTSERMKKKIFRDIDEYFPSKYDFLVHVTRQYGPHPKDAHVPGFFETLSLWYERHGYPPRKLL